MVAVVGLPSSQELRRNSLLVYCISYTIYIMMQLQLGTFWLPRFTSNYLHYLLHRQVSSGTEHITVHPHWGHCNTEEHSKVRKYIFMFSNSTKDNSPTEDHHVLLHNYFHPVLITLKYEVSSSTRVSRYSLVGHLLSSPQSPAHYNMPLPHPSAQPRRAPLF